MLRLFMITIATLFVHVGSAQAMDCGKVFTDLTKAISGHLTMPNRVDLMRGAVNAYDSCMIGDTKRASATREMIMQQIAKGLGARN